MSGRFYGVQARLGGVCPGSLFVHCCNHNDLVLQEVVRQVPLIANTLQFLQSTSTVIRESTKQKTRESFFRDEVKCNLLGLCPTRWCVRGNAISRADIPNGPVKRGQRCLDFRNKHKKSQLCSAFFTPSHSLLHVKLWLKCLKLKIQPLSEYIQTLREHAQALRTDNAVEEMLRKTSASSRLARLVSQHNRD